MQGKLTSLLQELGMNTETYLSLLGIDCAHAMETLNTIEQDDLIELYYDDPVGYAEDVLNFFPDEQQAALMLSVKDNKRTSCRAGQGVGKTAALACITIWYLHMRYMAKIIVTAPTAQQLSIVMWAEIAKWLMPSAAKSVLEQTKTFVYRKGYELEWFANAKVASQKENMLGLHADDLLIICDEAPGIKDDILEALLGTISGEYNKIVMIGNPTKNTGIFYDSHNSLSDQFNCLHINAENSERTDKEQHQILKRKYGEDSNVYRVLVRGEFPLDEDDVFIPLELVLRNRMKNPIANIPATELEETPMIDIGCDVARKGNNKTVIMYKINKYCDVYKQYTGKRTTRTAAELKHLATVLHEKFPDAMIPIKIDDTGVGGGVSDMMVEWKEQNKLDWLIIEEINFGKKIKSRLYVDTTTLMASIVRDLLDAGELVVPDEEELYVQLAQRKYHVQPDGRQKLWSKDEMAEEGYASPDFADACYLTCLTVDRRKRYS